MESKKKQTTFSKNLIKLRKERGISQKELAELTGISQRMIVYYENNCINPPLNKVKLIANALNISIQDLLEIDDNVQNLILKFDTKTLKKVKEILSLEPQDRAIIYKLVTSLIENRKLKKQLQETKK